MLRASSMFQQQCQIARSILSTTANCSLQCMRGTYSNGLRGQGAMCELLWSLLVLQRETHCHIIHFPSTPPPRRRSFIPSDSLLSLTKDFFLENEAGNLWWGNLWRGVWTHARSTALYLVKARDMVQRATWLLFCYIPLHFVKAFNSGKLYLSPVFCVPVVWVSVGDYKQVCFGVHVQA